MKKLFTSALVAVALLSVGAPVSASAKSVKRPVRTVKTVKNNNSSFNADMRINVTKGYKYLGISEKKAMFVFNKCYSVKHLRSYIGKNSRFSYRTATSRFNKLVKSYQVALKKCQKN